MTRGSVIVPAHDEAAVIRRCLDALFDGVDGELEVVVACNGCTDDTAALARASGHDVRVIEIDAASKPAAIRAAEATGPPFPRLYLDADIELAGRAAVAVLDELAHGSHPAARPPIHFDSSRSSAPVRAYYRARGRAPELMERLWGAGVYGLSRTGRERFGAYPDVVAEDLFVDQHFDRAEIAIVATEPVVVRVPRTVGALLRILRRTYRGNDANQRDLSPGDGTRSRRTSTGDVLRQVVSSARLGPAAASDALVYVSITSWARLRARFGRGERWERDDSSRET